MNLDWRNISIAPAQQREFAADVHVVEYKGVITVELTVIDPDGRRLIFDAATVDVLRGGTKLSVEGKVLSG